MEVHGLKQLSLHEIADLDGGRIGEAMNQALKRIASDMDDRPGDDRPRKITLEIAAIPVVAEGGDAEGCKIQIQVKESLPTRKSKVYDMGLRRGGMVVFQPMALDNHMQTPLEFGEE
jgi:hypothetical protein